MCLTLALGALGGAGASSGLLTALSIGSSALGFIQRQKAEQAEYERQKRQNEIARENAIKRYASEALRIRQVQQETAEKDLQGTLEARKKEAQFVVQAGARGVALSGSTNRLLQDYYRVQGNYTASLERNLNINVSQFKRNLDAIQFGQESQSTYVTPPNPILNFASSAMNVANGYYQRKYNKELAGLKNEF
jgi:uncharacterized protein HemX